MPRFLCSVFALLFVALAAGYLRAEHPTHGAAYWRGIAGANFTVPAGDDADALAWELTSYLSAEDPEWRDGFGFEITSAWLQRGRISAGMRARLLERWRDGLRRTAAVDAAVLERAFSALNLSVLIATDNREPAFAGADVRALLDEALVVFARETDRRGYDARLGWVHAAAHEADLLKFLARSRHCVGEDLRRILGVIAARAEGSAEPWIWGEEERLAAVVLSAARRPECEAAELTRFVARLAKLPEGFAGARLDLPVYHRARNGAALLRVLHLSLAAGNGPRDAELAATVLAALRS